jgi:hypothetical protein
MGKKPPNVPPLTTWEFFRFIKKTMGMTYLQNVFSIGYGQIQRYQRNPDVEYGDKSSRNPLDRYEILLRDLMDDGLVDVARAVVSRQALIVGCSLAPIDCPTPNQPTIERELLDNEQVKARYNEVLLDPQSTLEEVMYATDKLIDEIRQDVVKLAEERGWELDGCSISKPRGSD